MILCHVYLLRSRGVVSGDICILANRLEKPAALMSSALAAQPLFTAPFSLQREFFQECAQLARLLFPLSLSIYTAASDTTHPTQSHVELLPNEKCIQQLSAEKVSSGDGNA